MKMERKTKRIRLKGNIFFFVSSEMEHNKKKMTTIYVLKILLIYLILSFFLFIILFFHSRKSKHMLLIYNLILFCFVYLFISCVHVGRFLLSRTTKFQKFILPHSGVDLHFWRKIYTSVSLCSYPSLSRSTSFVKTN